MAEAWQLIETRGQQTLGVWGTFDPTFKVGDVTFAAHSTAVAALEPLAQLVTDQDTVVNAARALRDVNLDLVQDMNVRMPRKLSGDLPKGDPLHHDIDLLRGIRLTSEDRNEERGLKVHSLWKKYNERQTTQMPPKPVLIVGGITVESFGSALGQLEPNDQTVEDELAERRKRASALTDAMEEVDVNNKRWYASWSGEFAVGTPEHDALAQIDTGSPTPLPTALEIEGVAWDGASAAMVSYVPGGGDHSTTQTLQFQSPTDASFGHDVPVTQPSQLVTDSAFLPTGIYQFRTITSNSVGDTISAEWSITK